MGWFSADGPQWLLEINGLAAGTILGAVLSCYVLYFRKPVSICLAAVAGAMIAWAMATQGDRNSAAIFGAVAAGTLGWLLMIARPPNQWRYE